MDVGKWLEIYEKFCKEGSEGIGFLNGFTQWQDWAKTTYFLSWTLDFLRLLQVRAHELNQYFLISTEMTIWSSHMRVSGKCWFWSRRSRRNLLDMQPITWQIDYEAKLVLPLKNCLSLFVNWKIRVFCQAPGPGLVLAWSYHGLVPFLVKTGWVGWGW